jgi:hypothetical protein
MARSSEYRKSISTYFKAAAISYLPLTWRWKKINGKKRRRID